MIDAQTLEALSDAVNKVERAKAYGMGLNTAKDRLKTIMFGCYPDLVALAKGSAKGLSSEEADKLNKQIEDLKKQNEALNGTVEELNKSLEQADAEYNEIRKELRELKESKSKHRADKADDASVQE